MKKRILLIVLSFLQVTYAEFEVWTSVDDRKATMKLIKVDSIDGMLTGTFKLKTGKTIILSSDKLSVSETSRLENFSKKESDELELTTTKDVFHDDLAANLVSLNGKRFKTVKDFQSPNKYYLFYKTASWCPPCRKFTPTLVDFYDEYKSKYSEDFEIILITSDRTEDAMLEYAKDKKMTWPHIDQRKVKRFSEKHPFPGRGIPNTILTDIEGNIITSSYEGESYKGPSAPMEKLASLLESK